MLLIVMIFFARADKIDLATLVNQNLRCPLLLVTHTHENLVQPFA